MIGKTPYYGEEVIPAERRRRFQASLVFHGGAVLVTWSFALLAWHSRSESLSLPIYLAGMGGAWMGAVAAWLSDRNGRPQPWWVLIVCALLIRCLAFSCLPLLEDDPWRYLWDGYQTATHGTPYGRAPSDSFGDPQVPLSLQRVLDRVNHPDLPTVYGPSAQLAFYFSYVVSPGSLWPWKVILGAADIVVLVILARSGVRGAFAFWTFCPLLLQSTWASAHIDGLAVAFTVAALTRNRSARGALSAALLLALAVGVRPIALLVAPWILRRNLRAWISFLAMVVALHLPVVLGGGWPLAPEVAERLAGWEFNPSVYALLATALDPTLARWIVAGGFGVLWLLILQRHPPSTPSSSPPGIAQVPGASIFGFLWLLSPVVNPWYLVWLAPFIAVRPAVWSVTALAVVGLSYVTGLRLGDATLGTFEHPPWLRPVEYGAIALAGIADWVITRSRSRPR